MIHEFIPMRSVERMRAHEAFDQKPVMRVRYAPFKWGGRGEGYFSFVNDDWGRDLLILLTGEGVPA